MESHLAEVIELKFNTETAGPVLNDGKIESKGLQFLVACYATLRPTMSVCRSVPFLLFWRF